MIHRAQVLGLPSSYGNKTPGITKTGRLYVRERNSSGVRSWQDALRRSMAEDAPEAPWTEAVLLSILVGVRRPRGHFKRDGSLSKQGRETPFPLRKPDLDKVGRVVADCGTGIWYVDDALVTDWKISRRWTLGSEGTHVAACPLGWTYTREGSPTRPPNEWEVHRGKL